MSKGPKKAAKPKQQPKQEELPPREKVKLTDNLPKIPIRHRIEQIRRIVDANEYIMQKYIPEEKKRKYRKNFELFDRNYDQLLIYEEVKEFLISIGQMVPQEDLKQFYKEMLTKRDSSEGLPVEGLQFEKILDIVLQKMREEDIEQQLHEAFNIVLDGKKEGGIQSDDFKEYLMTMGYKWPEDMADAFIKEFEPKGEKKIHPNDVIKKLIKR